MHDSKLALSKWAAFYLFSTNLKGVSSMKLHRDLEITQKNAWHMAHRIRETWNDGDIVAALNILGTAHRVVNSTDATTLQGFVHGGTELDAQVYTDEALAYQGLHRLLPPLLRTVETISSELGYQSGTG